MLLRSHTEGPTGFNKLDESVRVVFHLICQPFWSNEKKMNCNPPKFSCWSIQSSDFASPILDAKQMNVGKQTWESRVLKRISLVPKRLCENHCACEPTATTTTKNNNYLTNIVVLTAHLKVVDVLVIFSFTGSTLEKGDLFGSGGVIGGDGDDAVGLEEVSVV